MNDYLNLFFVTLTYMTFWFGIALAKHRNDVANIAWGLGFVFIAWYSHFLGGVFAGNAATVNILVTAWGFRLVWHIFRRNRGKPEDYRYAAWRREWGKWFVLRSFLQVFLLQGVLLFLIALPVLYINMERGGRFGMPYALGIAVWLAGFIFETVGDAQLAAFLKNPANRGKLMESGLWKYSRHPNYFGEVVQWWGIFIIAAGIGSGFWTVLGPLTITILIIFVSGVPMLEKKYAGRLDFESYKKRTSVFFPLPRRS